MHIIKDTIKIKGEDSIKREIMSNLSGVITTIMDDDKDNMVNAIIDLHMAMTYLEEMYNIDDSDIVRARQDNYQRMRAFLKQETKSDRPKTVRDRRINYVGINLEN